MPAYAHLRVLIVEGRQDYRERLHRMLTKVGCVRIAEASDGQEGLNAPQNALEVVDLVVCNLDMGTIDAA